MVTISFFKCGYCYTYINVLAAGLFTACDGGFVYNIFSLTVSVQWAKLFLDPLALLFTLAWSVRLGMVDFDVKLFYYDC